MPTENNDLYGAKALSRDDAAQTNRTVADNGHSFSLIDLCHSRRMMSGPHHVRESKQRRHQRIVGADRQNEQRSVSLGDTQGLCLSSTGLASGSEEAAVDARGLQPLVAEHAGSVGVRKRHHDNVASPDRAHFGADGLDYADRLMAHTAACVRGLQLVVGPKIAPTDTGASDTDDRISRMHNGGIGDVLDPDIAGAVHDSCTHKFPSVLGCG